MTDRKSAAATAPPAKGTSPARPPAPLSPERRDQMKRELGALQTLKQRRAAEVPIPHMRTEATEKGVELFFDHENQQIGIGLLANALGVSDGAFLNGLLAQLGNATGAPGKKIDEGDLNFMLDVIRGTSPRDQTEVMLAAQMAVIHMATMRYARRLAFTNTSEQQDSSVGALNKFARTFAAQVEAMKRYRTGGEQRVVVQHVHVGEGGQAAIVGAVTTGGAGVAGKGGVSP